jgi:hypothetical protein
VSSPFLSSDYDDDSLESGLLQLASPCCLVLDESALSNGVLNETGLVNLRVLSKLLQTHTIDYDFQYQQLTFDVEYAILLMSVGGKSLLQQEGGASQSGIDLELKLAPTAGVDALYAHPQQQAVPTEEEFAAWRMYLSHIRLLSFAIAPSMSACIEDSFVALRASSPASTNESTLHLLLNLARLHSLSHGEKEMNTQMRWKEVMHLFERIQSRNSTG